MLKFLLTFLVLLFTSQVALGAFTVMEEPLIVEETPQEEIAPVEFDTLQTTKEEGLVLVVPEITPTRTDLGVGVASLYEGFGDNVPFDQANKIILPEDWTVISHIEGEKPNLTWMGLDGSTTWLEVYGAAAKENGLDILVSWPQKIVYVGSAGTEMRPSWVLRPGMLKPQLKVWCQTAGYELIWDLDQDFLVEAGMTFDGSFETSVEDIFRSYYSQGTKIDATLWQGNKKLVIGG